MLSCRLVVYFRLMGMDAFFLERRGRLLGDLRRMGVLVVSFYKRLVMARVVVVFPFTVIEGVLLGVLFSVRMLMRAKGVRFDAEGRMVLLVANLRRVVLAFTPCLINGH